MTSSKTSGLKTRLAMAVLAATVLTAALLAQSERGTITWTVQDATGAVVPEAKVTLTNTQTSVNFTIPTNASGDYTVPQLQVGVYSVKFEKEGFRPATVSGIVLNASMTARADAKLEVGAAAQAIEVSADAISIATENAKMSVTANNKLVDELPLVVGGAMRSPFNLASLTPEAKEIGGVRGFILGGGQAAGYGTSLDGVSANTTRALQSDWVATNAPSVEAVTEFTVDTNEFKAEFGQASGGIMSFASKSGTNDYHGSAYDFARNEAFAPTISSTMAAALREPPISSATSAHRSAAPPGFQKSITVKTGRFSSGATKPSGTGTVPMVSSARYRRRRCTTGIFATG